jgi:hypothetical protein
VSHLFNSILVFKFQIHLGPYLQKFVDTNVDVSPDVVYVYCEMELASSINASEISSTSRVLCISALR